MPPQEANSEGIVTNLNVSDLVLDLDLQARAEMNPAKSDEYADALRAWSDDGESPRFPPIDVHEIDGKMFVVDGFHRVEGARKAGTVSIAARVHSGSSRERAVMAAAGSNTTHGLPRTQADKRRAVAKVLGTGDGAKWSDREIARWCGVSHPSVSKIRAEMASTGKFTSQNRERVGRDGRTYNTENIGRKTLEALESAVPVFSVGSFLDVRDSLDEIRDRQLYRGEHETFEAYLESRWGVPQDVAIGADGDRLTDLMLTAFVARLCRVPVALVLAASEVRKQDMWSFEDVKSGKLSLREAVARLGIVLPNSVMDHVAKI